MEDISFSPEGICPISSPRGHGYTPSPIDLTPSPIEADPTPSPSPINVDSTPSLIEDEANNVEAQGGISRLKSKIWQHFKKIKVNGIDKAECNYCKKLLGGKAKNGTKHLWQHHQICVQYKILMRGMKGQAFLKPKVVQGKQELGAGTYDTENARGELAKAIIMHEYPLSIVDHLGFRRYSASLQPVFQVPTRNTIKEIMKIYENERATSLKLLDSLDRRVAITSDMWTSTNQKRGYMAITPHYVDGSWNLQSQILRFYEL